MKPLSLNRDPMSAVTLAVVALWPEYQTSAGSADE